MALITKENIKSILPNQFVRSINIYNQKKTIKHLNRQESSASNLIKMDAKTLKTVLDDNEILQEWNDVGKKINVFFNDSRGSVNIGDRRAIYNLVRKLSSNKVLEIGTHLGGSTLFICEALRRSEIETGQKHQLTTVDIRDVNSNESRPWAEFGMQYSPLEMAEKLELDGYVNFFANESVDFLETCSDRFDFIFLDGDHSATAVYQEVPIALNLLNKGGCILLHDYFPNSKPLWSNGSVIDGPYIAVEKLKKEGLDIEVLPLGALSWVTKLDSYVTSLAVLTKS